ELQGSVAGVLEVVPRTGGNHDREVALDLRLATIDPDFAPPLLDPEELIAIRMDLLADLLARLHGHQHELQLAPRVQNAPEVRIPFGHSSDISHEPFHGTLLFISIPLRTSRHPRSGGKSRPSEPQPRGCRNKCVGVMPGYL